VYIILCVLSKVVILIPCIELVLFVKKVIKFSTINFIKTY